MIDTVLNLLFRCSHRRLSRPIAPLSKPGAPSAGSYVVCLDCGKHFAYDMESMRVGKRIDPPAERLQLAEVPPAHSRGTKVKMAFAFLLPVAVMIGSIWKRPRGDRHSKQ